MKDLKNGTIIITVIILLLVSFSGCISPTELEPTPEEPKRRPNHPTLVIDEQEYIHIIWRIGYYGSSNICYSKIKNYDFEINKKIISSNSMLGTKSIIDSSNNIHIFFLSKLSLNENWNIYYSKIDENGEILINTKKVAETNFEEKYTTTRFFDIVTDSEENINLLWLKDESHNAGYLKLNLNSDVIYESTLSNFFDNVNFRSDIPLFDLHIDIDSKSILHAVWDGGYNKLNTENFAYNNTNIEIFGKGIRIDSKDIIYIYNSKNITKLSNNNSIISSYPLNNISLIPNYPLIIADDGDYIYLGDNGSLDSNNNLHVWSIYVETEVWTSGRHYNDYDFKTLYYSKISKNGTVLIDNMIVDTDGEPSWDNDDISTFYSILTFGIILIILIVIIIILFKRESRYKKRNN